MNLQVIRFDFNSGVASGARPSMNPSDAGEYCLYSDACRAVEQALESQVKLHEAVITPRLTCGHKVPLDGAGMSYTYCMFTLGHEGQCK